MIHTKNAESISPEYIHLLAEWLKINQATYFNDENRADSWADFVTFPEGKTDRNHLCMPKEIMLIDRRVDDVHMYCICTVKENRKVGLEIPVIEVSELDRSYWLNGYFLLPSMEEMNKTRI